MGKQLSVRQLWPAIRRSISSALTPRRRSYMLFGALVAVLVAGVELIFHANNPHILISPDSPSFTINAHNLWEQGQFVNPLRQPVYPALIGLVFRLFGSDNLDALYTVQQAIFVLSALEMYVLAALIVRRPWVACVLALLVGLNLYPLGYANILIAEGLTLFLVLALLITVVLFLRAPSRRGIWLVTFATIVLCFTRAEWVYLPLPLFLYLGWMALRRGNLRQLLPHLALSLLVVYALVGAYIYENGVQSHYYGISFAANANLLGKVLQYHLSGADPQYAATDRIVRAYEATGATEPFVLGEQVDPALSANWWALAASYSISVIEHNPVPFAVDSAGLFFDPQGVTYDYDFDVANRPYARLIGTFSRGSTYLGWALLLAPIFAFLWWALLLWRPTRKLLVVEAMGAVGLVVVFDRLLTDVGSYSDYLRIQSPIAPPETLLTFGALFMAVLLVAGLLTKKRPTEGTRAAGTVALLWSPARWAALASGSGAVVAGTSDVPATNGLIHGERVRPDGFGYSDGASIANGNVNTDGREAGNTKGEPRVMQQDEQDDKQVVIMGAGPAGLTAAYELTRHQVPALVLEADPAFVGGISRTEQRDGYRFDIGGHRFFSKSQEIEDFWTEVAGDLLLTRGRLSRIYYRGKYFAYPLKAGNALLNMGPVETVRCLSSYAWAKLRPVKNPQSLEDWVRNQFGYRLFSIFFKTYTEKVWGISTKELSADWAAQRIKGLNMAEAIKSALPSLRRKQKSADGKGRQAVIKTLIDEFRYPRLGPGQLWERVRDLLEAKGQRVELGQRVAAVLHTNGLVSAVVTRDVRTGEERTITGTDFISTLPIRELVRACVPPLPEHVRQAAESLKYRDFLTVAVVIDKAQMFPDNWIYIHDASVQVGRMQNFKNWSPEMVPDSSKTCLGLEYFCFEGDGLWDSSDEQLVELARRELAQLGMCQPEEVLWGAVVRQPKAYPVYDDVYKQHLAVIRDYLREALPNLQLVGRNGMHHYNNQDHSMMTALLVARNIATGTHFDQWKVNTDAEYHEEARLEDEDRSGRQVPKRVPALAGVEK